MVTVFTPPAVPAGEPPMNMNIRYVRQDAGRKDSWGMVANPAVRRVTDWNSAAIPFSGQLRSPKVAGLSYSKSSVNAVPARTRARVTESTIFACRFILRG